MSAEKFTITILGSNSALPANNRNPTSQLLKAGEYYYLIDCGEGTQLRLRRMKVKLQKIKAIFISHMHGDHYFGLPGLLNTLNLLGRTNVIVIIAPKAMKEILDLQMRVGGGRFQFPIDYRYTDDVFKSESSESVYDDKKIEVKAFPLKHRIPCLGFVFKQKKGLNTYLPEQGEKFGVGVKDINSIKQGHDFVNATGEVIPNASLTIKAAEPKSYVYCTDTKPIARTIKYSSGTDMLYHEATFSEADADRAKQTFHSTAAQAAEIAKKAKVKKLLIGHFSARYQDLSVLLEEAQSLFANSALAIEGEEFEI